MDCGLICGKPRVSFEKQPALTVFFAADQVEQISVVGLGSVGRGGVRWRDGCVRRFSPVSGGGVRRTCRNDASGCDFMRGLQMERAWVEESSFAQFAVVGGCGAGGTCGGAIACARSGGGKEMAHGKGRPAHLCVELRRR